MGLQGAEVGETVHDRVYVYASVSRPRLNDHDDDRHDDDGDVDEAMDVTVAIEVGAT